MIPLQRNKALTNFNWFLLLCLIILTILGVVNLYSASSLQMDHGLTTAFYYQKQIYWSLLGFVVLPLLFLLDYRHIKSLVWPVYGLSLALLVYVLFLGTTVSGATRWIDLGYINFQPSKLAEMSVILLCAAFLSRIAGPVGWKELGKILLLAGLPATLVLMQPDLGSALLILMVAGGIVLFKGIDRRVLLTLLIIIPMLAPGAWFALEDYKKERVYSFIQPEQEPLGSGYTAIQSQIAVGSGQFWGKGFLEGTQGQMRFLPSKHTDFVFSIYGEEWGFVGSFILISLFCLFLYQIALVAGTAKDPFGAFLACGVFFSFFWQILVNLSMVLGLMPVVGIPLPFFSYGGTSTLINFIMLGLVFSISMRRYFFTQE